jgi:hypothetical protein
VAVILGYWLAKNALRWFAFAEISMRAFFNVRLAVSAIFKRSVREYTCAVAQVERIKKRNRMALFIGDYN